MKNQIVRILIAFILFGVGASARADVVTEWNSTALNAIRIDKTPPKASRDLAILHVAIYDAVNGITRSHEPYLVGGLVPASASIEAAASAAAYQVLASLFPAQKVRFDVIYRTHLAGLPNKPQEKSGIAWGESVAAHILAARATDGFDMVVPPPVGSGPGAWVSTPPA